MNRNLSGILFSIFSRVNFIVCIVIFILFFSYSSLSQAQNNFNLNTIVIDAGHGGKDPGAVYKEKKKVLGKEKDITLSIALKLGNYIKTHFKDIKVIYTRDKDEFIELHKRAAIANKNKADLFVSIHANSSKKKEPFGSETFVMGIHKNQGNLEVAMTENSVVLKEKNYNQEYEGIDPNSPEAYIIFNMLQNTNIEQSLNLASKIQNEYKNQLLRFDRGVKQAVFFVLWKTVMPSILTEVGFISNKEEAKYILSESVQQQISYSIFNAIRNYKKEIEGIKDDGIVIEKPEYKSEVIPGFETVDTVTVKENVKEKNEPDNKEKEDSVEVKETVQLKDTTDSKKENETTKKNENNNKKDNTKKEDRHLFKFNDIVFKIQITSSKTKIPVNSEKFKGLKVEEFEIDGTYKYLVCSSKSYDEIVNLQKLIRLDFPDSFIIALKNGKKISINDALKEIKN